MIAVVVVDDDDDDDVCLFLTQHRPSAGLDSSMYPTITLLLLN
jgi:hypothetical protein